ncbi:hypothetical protein ACOMHN_019203 [Nucella lapillus]
MHTRFFMMMVMMVVMAVAASVPVFDDDDDANDVAVKRSLTVSHPLDLSPNYLSTQRRFNSAIANGLFSEQKRYRPARQSYEHPVTCVWNICI